MVTFVLFSDADRGSAPLQALNSFCGALSNPDADGRIVIDRGGQSLKFILLHAAQHFAKVESYLKESLGSTKHLYADYCYAVPMASCILNSWALVSILRCTVCNRYQIGFWVRRQEGSIYHTLSKEPIEVCVAALNVDFSKLVNCKFAKPALLILPLAHTLWFWTLSCYFFENLS